MMVRCVAILPAGGTGSRFGAAYPKQFTPLLGQSLLAHSIRSMLQDSRIQTVFVALGTEYQTFLDRERWEGRVIPLVCAGTTRAETVRNALQALQSELDPDDWVLVHDAVRPCLSAMALKRLLDTLLHDEVGGLLALPVPDTLKREDGFRRVRGTVDRSGLWSAQTPQMFRFEALRQALRGSTHHTDEASAMEATGQAPLLVRGEPANIKVTYPEDLQLAEWVMKGRLETGKMP